MSSPGERLDADDPSFPELLSHPGGDGREPMPLEEHLLRVGGRGAAVVPGGDDAAAAARIVGLAHDFGKATPWFQAKIGNGTEGDGPDHHARVGCLLAYHVLRERGYSTRTRCAAVVAVAKHHGSIPDIEQFVMDRLDQPTTWELHGDSDVLSATTDGNAFNAQAVKQVVRIDQDTPGFARACFAELLPERDPDVAWEAFRSRLVASTAPESGDGDSLLGALRADLTELEGRTVRFDRSIREGGELYTETLQLYGTLTFADKTHAARIAPDDERLRANSLDPGEVQSYLDALAATADAEGLEADLNTLRGEIQRVLAGGDDALGDPVEAFLDSRRSVGTLNLPTGYGKTLAGLLTASRILEARGGDRIVYALPFTSIIDQAAEVIGDLVAPDGGERPELGRSLTVHHHLSESLTLPDADEAGDEEGTDEDAGRATMLAESWRAGVTLTTFVQLFESLAGPRNVQSMKLPALEGSVVIVDEPQALPLRWWPLVERLLETLVAEYDATVLLMTATQPRIVDGDDVFDLIAPDTLERLETRCFEAMPERVSYRFDPTALAEGRDDADLLTHATAAERVADAAVDDESVLAVCNTIDSVGHLYDEVTDVFDRRNGYVDVAVRYDDALTGWGGGLLSGTEPERAAVAAFADSVVAAADPQTPAVLSLSTRVRPRDRGTLFAVVRRLIESDIPLVLTSTQLVEAGVDVSFGRVFRDVAPLDSVVQVAGRCNRSYERAPDPGRVTVWRLGPPEGKSLPPSEAVYARRQGEGDLDLLRPTRQALSNVNVTAGETLPEERITGDAIDDYQRLVGSAVDDVAGDNSLLAEYQRGDGAALRRASLIETRFSFEVYVPRTRAETEQVAALSAAIESHEFDEASTLRDELAGIRISVPVYEPGSDAAAELGDLPPLVTDASLGDPTERVCRPDKERHARFFDAATGFAVPESNVEGRFL